MDPWGTVIQQKAYLAHGKFQPHLAHGLYPALFISLFKIKVELAGNIGPAQRKHPP